MTVKIFNHRDGGTMGGVKMFNHNVTEAAVTKGTILNHSMDDVLAADVERQEELAKKYGLFRYSGRALSITTEKDVIQLHPELRNDWVDIHRHYENCGLKCSREVIWDDSYSVMTDESFKDYEWSLFFFGQAASSVLGFHDWASIVHFMNNKNNTIQLAQSMEIPTPVTDCFADKKEIQDLKDFSYPCYLKLAVSVSGLGVFHCKDIQDLEKNLLEVEKGTPFQIQAEVKAITFINLQYRVEDGKVYRFLATEQILKGNSHDGNKFPTLHQPWYLTDKMALLMSEKGMRSIFAFDVAVVEGKQGYEYLLIECNPRFNGASYPSLIAERLGIEEWSAKNFLTDKRSLSEIDLGEIEYSPDEKTGVIIFNWGPVAEGKLGILLAGNSEQQDILEKKLQKILN